MNVPARAVLELDGETYVEYQAYDSLMVSQMWGYSLSSREEIKNIDDAQLHVSSLLAHNVIKKDDAVFIGGVRQGTYLFLFEDEGIRTTGTEENKEMVESIKKLSPTSLLSNGDMSTIPLPEKSQDAGFFHSSLFMNENTQINRTQLKEIKRILKPGGTVIIEGANGAYWEPVRKKLGELYEYSSKEEGVWALKKDPSLARWRRKDNFLWLEFFFVTVNSEQLRVNHVYLFIPRQDGITEARYYHEVVNYEPFEYRLNLLNEEHFTNLSEQKLTLGDVYKNYEMNTQFSSLASPGGVIIARYNNI
ncbi:MAG: methyltransferase domain-containing protein [bacterium]|nr:methyltransferase domain-containing protein [bacterium]